MPAKGREQRAAIALQWSTWLRETASARRMRQIDIVTGSNGQIASGTVAKWWTAENTASPEAAIAVARVLHADAIDALRAAGHHEIADLAEQIRTDPIGARITRELENIEDDEWLRWLDDEHARGIVTDDEHRQMRADYLRRKEESIRLMRADYERARRRDQPGATEKGSSAAM